MTDVQQEGRVRSKARRAGYKVCKSRRAVDLNNRGDFMLIECNHNICVVGQRFDPSLDDIEAFLDDRE